MSRPTAELQAIKTELNTDPLARGYAAMSDEAAGNSLSNVRDRPGDGSVDSMLDYLLVNKNRTNTGTDLTTTSMLGRLIHAAGSNVGDLVFGSTTTLTLDMKHSLLALLEVVRNPNNGTLPFADLALQVLLTDAVNAGVMKAADKTAIIALSNNLRSRAAELGLGSVSTSDVADARRLP